MEHACMFFFLTLSQGMSYFDFICAAAANMTPHNFKQQTSNLSDKLVTRQHLLNQNENCDFSYSCQWKKEGKNFIEIISLSLEEHVDSNFLLCSLFLSSPNLK